MALRTATITLPTPREALNAAVDLPSSEPTDSQIVCTIAESDLAVLTNGVSLKHTALLYGGGKNTTGSNRTVYYRVLKNGVSVTTGSALVAAGYYYTVNAYDLYDIAVGDVVELRFWASVASGVNWDFQGLAVCPTRVFYSDPGQVLENVSITVSTFPNFTLGSPSLNPGFSYVYLSAGAYVGVAVNKSFANCINDVTHGLFQVRIGDYVTSAGILTSATYRPRYYGNYVPTAISFRSTNSVMIAETNRSADVMLEDTQITKVLTYQEDSCPFTIKSGVKPSNGEEIIISKDGIKEFAGIIDKVDEDPQSTDVIFYKCSARDYTYQLDAKMVVEDYEGYTADAIVRDIITKYCTAFTSVHVYTGAPTIEKKVFPYMKPSDCLKWLANYVGWDWYVDYDKDVWFFDPTVLSFPAPITIDVSTTGIRNLSHNLEIEGLRNRVYVIGGTYLSDLLSPALEWKADGLLTSWTLPWAADYESASLTVNGADVTLGQSGVDSKSSFEYMLDSEKQTLSCGTASAPADGVTMSLSCRIPLDVITQVDDKDSQVAVAAIQGGDGIYENVINDDSITTLEAAIAAGQADLDEWANPQVNGSFQNCTYTGWAPGQLLPINLPDRGIVGDYIIQKVTMTPLDTETWDYKVEYGGRLIGLPDYLRTILSAQQQADDSATTPLHKVYKEVEGVTVTDSLSVSAPRTPPYVCGDADAICGFIECSS